MLNFLRSPAIAQYGSALLVFVTAAIVGHQAAIGMNAVQWTGAAVSVLGSISVAVMVHVWPEKQKAEAGDKRPRG
jgi:hypothetical protein